jgi:hypothetical protein
MPVTTWDGQGSAGKNKLLVNRLKLLCNFKTDAASAPFMRGIDRSRQIKSGLSCFAFSINNHLVSSHRLGFDFSPVTCGMSGVAPSTSTIGSRRRAAAMASPSLV